MQYKTNERSDSAFHFIETPLYQKLITLLKAKVRLILIVGPSGCGKTETSLQALRDHFSVNPQMISGNKVFNTEGLLGARGFRNGEVVYDYGQLVQQLFQDSGAIVLDEMFQIGLDKLTTLLQLRSERSHFVHPDTGESIRIPENFAIIGTSNREAVDLACRRDSETALALFDGLETVLAPPLSRSQVKAIIHSHIGECNEVEAAEAMRLYDELSEALESQGKEPLSVRAAIAAAKNLASGMSGAFVEELLRNRFLPIKDLHQALELRSQFDTKNSTKSE